MTSKVAATPQVVEAPLRPMIATQEMRVLAAREQIRIGKPAAQQLNTSVEQAGKKLLSIAATRAIDQGRMTITVQDIEFAKQYVPEIPSIVSGN
jgi:histone H3/H4